MCYLSGFLCRILFSIKNKRGDAIITMTSYFTCYVFCKYIPLLYIKYAPVKTDSDNLLIFSVLFRLNIVEYIYTFWKKTKDRPKTVKSAPSPLFLIVLLYIVEAKKGCKKKSLNILSLAADLLNILSAYCTQFGLQNYQRQFILI